MGRDRSGMVRLGVAYEVLLSWDGWVEFGEPRSRFQDSAVGGDKNGKEPRNQGIHGPQRLKYIYLAVLVWCRADHEPGRWPPSVGAAQQAWVVEAWALGTRHCYCTVVR